MKKIILAAAVLMIMLSGNLVMAQEISSENLRRYAILMETVDAMKKEISDLTNEMIKNQEGMDGKRYLELAKAGGDAAKLDELGAKDYEKKFMELVTNMQDERKQAISDVVSILATKMLPDGGKVYKQIKDGLDSDPDLKARYEAIQQTINTAGN